MKEKFMLSCPTCGESFKMVEECHGDCGKMVCSCCSIDHQCLDCLIKRFKENEIKAYFGDKYAFKA